MPTASVLHYATECFEGLKLYRGFDGRLRLFRPSCNTQRMVQSAQRIALPTFDPNEFQKLIEKLCAVDGPKWLPASRPGTFLYLRPTMIGTADSLGVQKPNEALLYVVAVCCPQTEGLSSPAPQPQSPSQREVLKKTTSGPGLKLLASGEDTIRAWPGGFGFAKVGSNYGPSLMAQAQATAKGLDQVLWLFGKERLVTEAGACNFFVVWRTKEGQLQLITAPLDTKVILDGVTRRSVLELAKKGLSASREKRTGRTAAFDSLEVVEREFSMGEIESAVEENRLEEAFVVGTAVRFHTVSYAGNASADQIQIFLAPVSRIHVDGKDLDIPMSEGASGKYARLFRTWLWDIMCGAETHEWGMIIREED